jgi:hypothetical protein
VFYQSCCSAANYKSGIIIERDLVSSDSTI